MNEVFWPSWPLLFSGGCIYICLEKDRQNDHEYEEPKFEGMTKTDLTQLKTVRKTKNNYAVTPPKKVLHITIWWT